jgi:hypothetical protein
MIGAQAGASRARATAPLSYAAAASYRNAAVWSLRTLLAAAVFGWFAISAPRGPQLTLTLEAGRRALELHALSVGWLSSIVALATARASGFGGLAALSGASVVVTLALVEFRARSRAGYVLSLIAGILAAFAFLDVLRVGAGATGWVWAAALLLVLDRARGFALTAAAFAIAVAWCNVAPEGILAPLLAALYVLGRSIDRRFAGPRVWDGWLAVAACALATLCTPAGLGYLTLAPWAAHLHESTAKVLPLAPYLIAPRAYYGAFFASLVLGAALGISRRRTGDLLLLAAGLFLTLRNGADAPLLGIIAAPIFAESFAVIAPQFKAAPPVRERLADGLIAAIAFLLAISLGSVSHARAQTQSLRTTPYWMMARYAADGRPHTIFCSVVEWCDYAAILPNLRPFMDGRVERTDKPMRDAQHAIATVGTDWKKELARRRIDTVLTHRTDALAALLELSPHWTVVDGDADVVLLERETAR